MCVGVVWLYHVVLFVCGTVLLSSSRVCVCGGCEGCVIGLDRWCVGCDWVGVVLVLCVVGRELPEWFSSTSFIALGFLGSLCKVQIATDGPWG